MQGLDTSQLTPAGTQLDGLVRHKPAAQGAHVDMTAMIDLVFMLNIFFLVTSLVAGLAEIDLPAAKHVVAADLDNSVVLTVVTGREGGRPTISMNDGTGAKPLAEADQDQHITAEVERQLREGKKAVIIKAEKKIPLRDIARIAAAATTIEGTRLNLAVMEKD